MCVMCIAEQEDTIKQFYVSSDIDIGVPIGHL